MLLQYYNLNFHPKNLLGSAAFQVINSHHYSRFNLKRIHGCWDKFCEASKSAKRTASKKNLSQQQAIFNVPFLY